MRTGIANLPLHGGKAPVWLFSRMRALAREIAIALVSEYGPLEVLRRVADPFWFQAFGCVLGFDWHSSGLTTTTLGALKEGIRGIERDLGFFVAGGKGRTSRGTPSEILDILERNSISLPADVLVYSSRMSAKVDSSALQDGYQIYHHNFLFTRTGEWAVIQQGMNEANRYARRYHWFSENLLSFVNDPHLAVCCNSSGNVLNLVAGEAEHNRDATAELSREKPERLLAELRVLKTLRLPPRHGVLLQDIHPDHLDRILLKTYEAQARNFEALLGLEGVGAKTLRALALLGELLYQAPVSMRDPVRFSFAHGGKDGTPYPVNRAEYDRSIEILRKALGEAKVGRTEKLDALKRLVRFEING